ncbi:MAG: hypothetical protein HRT57_05940 [Crocinitomicaceae bacterium]|nr:hypothetical protein [Crocinitomicaceae bacterium]
MKSYLILITLLAFTTTVSAQNSRQAGIKTVSPSPNPATVANPLINFYGKELHYAIHKRNGVKVEHNIVDFLKFDEDGKFIDSRKGDISRGSWVYTESNKQLKLMYDGERYEVIFTIVEIQNTKIKFTTPTDKFMLYIPKKHKDSTQPVEISPIAE